jgi:putative oxidoreductase
MSTKGIKIIVWICIAVLTVQFLGAGITKLLGTWSAKFIDWDYPIALMYTIGLLEIMGVIGLYFSKTRKWSAVLFILVMIGAAYTHVSNGEYQRIIHNGIVAGLSFLVFAAEAEIRF